MFALFNYDDDFEAILILLLAFLPCVAINLNAETVLLRIGQDAKVARCVNSFFSNPLHAEFMTQKYFRIGSFAFTLTFK